MHSTQLIAVTAMHNSVMLRKTAIDIFCVHVVITTIGLSRSNDKMVTADGENDDAGGGNGDDNDNGL